jgi:hypothetical protein
MDTPPKTPGGFFFWEFRWNVISSDSIDSRATLKESRFGGGCRPERRDSLSPQVGALAHLLNNMA